MENLPGIDDDCNQLEVAEYVDEIYHYYWVMEVIIHFFFLFIVLMINVLPMYAYSLLDQNIMRSI